MKDRLMDAIKAKGLTCNHEDTEVEMIACILNAYNMSVKDAVLMEGDSNSLSGIINKVGIEEVTRGVAISKT